MDLTDIRAYRRWHRKAALRARDAGFDIVVVYAGHDGTLPTYFLGRRHNQRTDEYGGSLENRLRLFRELIEDTREAVGDSCGVVVRFAVDEMMGPDGLEWQSEGREAVEMLAELPDMWDVNVSDWSNDSMTSRQAGDQQARSDGRSLHLARRHGGSDPPRRDRRNRRGPALDRRSVPAQQNP
jgi:dimethylamine/trimethylamine dehydrogenase